ncbi:MAG: glucosaminidase domain-containing protein [Bacteroidetes bacterium]|nr:glucosaminidase domain-containing protein [Bacteroidota bacterium]HET6243455.1 glucosaminidase domain-containing protein [Bacteroidia bacterium]
MIIRISAPILTALIVFLAINSEAQPSESKMTRKEYIERYSEEAIKEMHASGIPASITLAQGILESGDGNSPLARYANNHFGIKCHKGWNGPTFIQDDDTRNECFRKYHSAQESFRDHSEFLKTRSWYKPLFELTVSDYEGWAHGLKKAGYATNPRYAELLIRLIEDNNLNKYDKLSEIPSFTQKSTPITATKPIGVALNISLKNNVKFIIARHGDSPFKIAKTLDMAPWQILKYNDLGKAEQIKAGDVIYLQPKRNKANEQTHVVKKGETLRSVSQQHAVKLKKLYRYNNLIEGDQVKVGETLNLRRRK